MNRVLILTETFAGYGHYHAALALKKGLERMGPGFDVNIVCTLPLISKNLESLLGNCYLRMLRYAPKMWGAAYESDARFNRWLRKLIKLQLAPKLIPIIEAARPQVIICTHALCLGACAMLKTKITPTFRLGAAVTDFNLHPFWMEPGVDFYLLSHPEMKQKLAQNLDVPSHVTGIPIDPSFSQPRPTPQEARKKMGWNPERLTVLVMGGGIGLGPLPHIMRSLHSLLPKYPFQLVTITGKNDRLRQELDRRYAQEPHVHCYGFVEQMAEIMAGADLILTKPGGMTSSEALASSLPLLICKPLPGQEEHNSHYLIHEQVAIRQDQIPLLPQELVRLIENPSLLETMRQRAKEIAKPHSAIHAAEIIAEYL